MVRESFRERRAFSLLALACAFATLSEISACSNKNAPSAPPTASATAPGSREGAQSFIQKNFTLIPDDQTALHDPAWRDAGGTVWSGLLTGNVSVKTLGSSCGRLGESAPTVEELHQLAVYLGQGSPFGFHPEDLRVQSGALQVGWGKLTKIMLLGSDSAEITLGALTGIDGRSGGSDTLMGDSDLFETATGWPEPFESNPTDPNQLNFDTICVFRDL